MAFDEVAFRLARQSCKSSKIKDGSNSIETYYYDPSKDSLIVEFTDGTVREIAYHLLMEDKYKEVREMIEREIANTHRAPGHLISSRSMTPSIDLAALTQPPDEPWICEWLEEVNTSPAPTPTPAPAPKPACPETPRCKRLIKI